MKISKTVWSAWKEEPLDLVFPDEWRITDYHLHDKPRLPNNTIYRIIDVAIEANLHFPATRRSTTACILVDDITRPTRWEIVLDFIISKLVDKGMNQKNIHVLVALAGHGKLTTDELAMKLGQSTCDRVNVHQHGFTSDLAWMNYDGIHVGLNKIYCRADLKLALGALLPHPFAGFSGGGKAVMPGIADLDSVRNNHRLVAFGKGKVFDTNNYIRNQMDAIAIKSGLTLLINALCDGRREVIELFAGPPCETYSRGVRSAQNYSAMKVEELHNIIILNAFPKDQELIQISNALSVYRTLPKNVKRECRTIVMVAKLSKGLGHHELYGPGGCLYKPPQPLSFIDGCRLMVFSPMCSVQEFEQMFAKEYKLANEWTTIIQEIECLGLTRHDIGIFHQASMQTANG